MALPDINLDDRNYAQLLAVLTAQIPATDWTDHNPSDPGITLMELLAWLGEMSLYRMNRVTDAHREKFLKLILDPPEAVTVDATLKLVPPRTGDIRIPAGIRFATDFKDGRRFVFESIRPAVLKEPAPGKEQTGVIKLRSWTVVKSEILGEGNDAPNQEFSLRQGPVLLDFTNASAEYSPNPQVKVGGIAWDLVPFLRVKKSRISPGLAARHFMVDEFDQVIRFGDGVFGAIPPAGAAIIAESYQVLEGSEALIKADSLKHILNPEDVAGYNPAVEMLSIAGNADAEGGLNFFSPEDRLRKGLEVFRNPGRLITAGDFERVILRDFNSFQDLSRATPKIARAVALMNRKPPLGTDAPARSHVTVMLLPELPPGFDAMPFAMKLTLIGLPAEFRKKAFNFLDRRKLITTRIHVVPCELQAVGLSASVAVFRDRNVADMDKLIKERVRQFLSLVSGGPERGGWPLGRTVRRSHLFRILEEVPGVDFVEGLALSPANADGDVDLSPLQLPALDAFNLLVKRA